MMSASRPSRRRAGRDRGCRGGRSPGPVPGRRYELDGTVGRHDHPLCLCVLECV